MDSIMAVQNMIPRRPPLSIVQGVNQVPVAKMVFITAASREDRNGDKPTWEKMMVL